MVFSQHSLKNRLYHYINKEQKIYFFFSNIHRTIPLWERIYCWVLMIVGLLGGIASTCIAVYNLTSAQFSVPCWVPGASANMTATSSH